MRAPTRPDRGGQAASRRAAPTGPSTGSLELPCLPIDALDIEGPVDFLKCDTEGAEVEVLRGAARLIARDRPWLLVEVHSVDNCLTLTRMLADWAYLFTVVRHPEYERYSHFWYSHFWLSCQPRECAGVTDAAHQGCPAGADSPAPR